MKINIKKLSFGVLALSISAAPIAVLSSCGSDNSNRKIDTKNFAFPSNVSDVIDGSKGNGHGTIKDHFIANIPELSHLEYSINASAFTAEKPTTLANGQKLEIKLVADENHKLDTNRKATYNVAGLLTYVDVPESFTLPDITFTPVSSGGIKYAISNTNIPTPPEHTRLKWATVINPKDEDFKDAKPGPVDDGTFVTLKLFAEDGYILSRTNVKSGGIAHPEIPPKI